MVIQVHMSLFFHGIKFAVKFFAISLSEQPQTKACPALAAAAGSRYERKTVEEPSWFFTSRLWLRGFHTSGCRSELTAAIRLCNLSCGNCILLACIQTVNDLQNLKNSSMKDVYSHLFTWTYSLEPALLPPPCGILSGRQSLLLIYSVCILTFYILILCWYRINPFSGARKVANRSELWFPNSNPMTTEPSPCQAKQVCSINECWCLFSMTHSEVICLE